ncbi:MAG: 16S rRNA (cytosine(967)-C(5))-methyltransferase RsmB [Ruminococcaceae bacterium]|nr:16S rRNA (cytosine(967)-C(5))-methyltransferase RsmB [Oscillospiraceae bacterium]
MFINPRKKAVSILIDIEKESAYTNIEMNKLRASGNFSELDVRFIGELINGVVKRKLTLDYVISKHSSLKLNKISPFVMAVLRIGVYQILYMDKVPDSAAVNESVKLVKKSAVYKSASFVNAVLRAVSASDIESLDISTDVGMSILYSFPLWIVERWNNRYGREFTASLLESMNLKPQLCVRRRKDVSAKDFVALMKNQGIIAEKIQIDLEPQFDYSFKLSDVHGLENVKAFEDGQFYVQDPAAAFAAYVLEPKKGDNIIDMCAAPGGKSLFIADLIDNDGKVTAFDIYDHKIKLIEDNSKKYSCNCIEAKIQDAGEYCEQLYQTADKVLCDVPCSGLGIIRKKPDIRYSHTSEDIMSLAELSFKILGNAAAYLKPGGTLVFSTCTIEPDENEKVTQRFLSAHPEFEPFPFSGEIFHKTFYPNIDGTDGFYVCRLRKIGETK